MKPFIADIDMFYIGRSGAQGRSEERGAVVL